MIDATLELEALKVETISAQAAENLERALSERDGLHTPRAAAVELLHEFRLIASALRPRDLSTQDDLVQEMALAALECKEPHTPSYYCGLGAWRARDYLRWWEAPFAKREGDSHEVVVAVE